jgi:excisionase family DNA binding protein
MRLAEAPDVLTVEQTAEVLGVGRGTAYEAVRQGQIPSLRLGRCIRIPRRALEALLSNSNDNDPAANPGRVEVADGDRRDGI